MKIDRCVVQLVVRDKKQMIRFAEHVDSQEELLWSVADERGELVYAALRGRLEAGPIVCKSAAELEVLLHEVVAFHHHKKAVHHDLFDRDFGFSLREMNCQINEVADTFKHISVVCSSKQFYQELNQPPRRASKLDKRV
jgi:hypothetical protein